MFYGDFCWFLLAIADESVRLFCFSSYVLYLFTSFSFTCIITPTNNAMNVSFILATNYRYVRIFFFIYFFSLCYSFFSLAHFDFSHVFWCMKFIRLIITCTQNIAKKKRNKRSRLASGGQTPKVRTLHLKVIWLMNKCLVLCGQGKKTIWLRLKLDLFETYAKNRCFFRRFCGYCDSTRRFCLFSIEKLW